MIKNGLLSLSIACLCGAVVSCQSGDKTQPQEITLTNRSAISLTDKGIAIKRAALTAIPEGMNFPLLLTGQGDTVAVQADDLDGDQEWDELFFVTDLPANGTQTLHLSWLATQPRYTPRTSVRFGKRTSQNTPVQARTSDTLLANQLPKSAGYGYQPYQTDGPTWENDKVGFRHYFDGRNAKDIFGKRVSYMSPETVGINAAGEVEDNYHVMEAWGRDVMAVGNSTGIGGIALMIGDTPYRLGVTAADSVNNIESTTLRLVCEGPVRSALRLGYTNWQPDGTARRYTLSEQPTIWPGMYAYRNTASVSGLQGDETLLIGMNNLDPSGQVTEIDVDDTWVVLLTHDRETYNNEWLLGLALILPKDAYLGYTAAPDTGNLSRAYFAKMKAQENQPVTYYAVGGWEMSDEKFKSEAGFKAYVQNLARQLAAEVDIEIK
ncbi:DUF4861 domain-containing protein [Pontibacter sp. E15-1]|uniref:DUF4861 domain-containing protein n=1 Tax=Pontibacter sp. E15-1 TaxID=2919918 RepID=UPI001F4F93E6|nr:DUF4861 domain-containing protein [Pontibacter sp. E15-1]MCJ8165943.1 DUF4861 domain-containing protein [Pontibacter sp. E15-1]